MSGKRRFGFEGFALGRRPELGAGNGASEPPRKRQLYRPGESDSDNEEAGPAYASDHEEQPSTAQAQEENGEEDPLDAFMAGIHQEVKDNKDKPVAPKPLRDEEDEDDPVESYMKARAAAGLPVGQAAVMGGDDSDEEVYATARAVDAAEKAAAEKGGAGYDSDDNILPVDKKEIGPIPPLDHSSIEYDEFTKDFYVEAPQIAAMSEDDIRAKRKEHGIRVSGFDVGRPVQEFSQCGFDAEVMAMLKKQSYHRPTPIQCQALPVVLSGRDVIGIAKTGSGKTAAFVLPMLVHIMDQEELEKGAGPIGVICAPTRELAQQIYTETKKFAKAYNLQVSGVYGGMSKFEQFKELKAGVEIVVATPGRLIDMLKMKALTMRRATYMVLDEADRMFDMGFEPQMRSIIGQIRPDRQTLLFSATMPRKIERLARDILTDPVRITVGEVGEANEDIRQIAEVLSSDAEKLPWLLQRLPVMVDAGDTLVFAGTKARVEELASQLRERQFRVAALHGDKDQASRSEVLRDFKGGVHHVLVATDVAARGLDIKSIKTVVNYDVAKDMDTHVHRIGRTGRAGATDGVAYTLVTMKQGHFAGELVHNLAAAGQQVPDALMQLANKDPRFRRQKRGGGGGGGGGGGKGQGRVGKGRGRGKRGVDFGHGLGFTPSGGAPGSEGAQPRSQGAPPPAGRGAGPPPRAGRGDGPPSAPKSRIAAVDSVRGSIGARFRNSFVAASTGTIGGHSAATIIAPLSQRELQSATPAAARVSGFTPAAQQKSGWDVGAPRAATGNVAAAHLQRVPPPPPPRPPPPPPPPVAASGDTNTRREGRRSRWDTGAPGGGSSTDHDRERSGSRDSERDRYMLWLMCVFALVQHADLVFDWSCEAELVLYADLDGKGAQAGTKCESVCKQIDCVHLAYGVQTNRSGAMQNPGKRAQLHGAQRITL
eukprot:jgi/Chlat1/823/Chrsp104S01178